MVTPVGLSARPTQASETVLAEEVPVTPASPDEEFEFVPIFPTIQRLEGAKTVRTYQMPPWADRAQYMMRATAGRPLRATVNLWIGPLRQVHTCKVDTEKGSLYPITSTIKFKKLAPVLKITTDEELSYPTDVAVVVPAPDRSKQLERYFMDIWRSARHPTEKQVIQGGTIGEGANGWGGSVRSWTFGPEVESVQVLGWSGDVGKKSFKMDFEVLQGVNNVKQNIFFQCGGSTQPLHAVIEIPKEGCVIRMRNKKFIEDGKVEFTIVPYKMRDYTAVEREPTVAPFTMPR
jgi:hypothetical protein